MPGIHKNRDDTMPSTGNRTSFLFKIIRGLDANLFSSDFCPDDKLLFALLVGCEI